MKIVLLESLGVPDRVLEAHVRPLLEGGHTFTAFPRDPDPNVQIARAADADVILIANMPLRGEVIDACPNLKFIDVAFTGVDHVDLEAARARGIRVSNAAGYATQAVAELTVCMMLSLLRRVPQMEERCRTGETGAGLLGSELQGKTVGIIGTGAIGRRTAMLCRAFGCHVLGYRRHVLGIEPDFIEFVPLETLLAQSDIVSLHCPLNQDSLRLINQKTIAGMKPGAIVINAARGPVVDSLALADALNSGYLGGAGIDVFEGEPPLPLHHPLLHSRNTIVTPHIAFSSQQSLEARCSILFDNLAKWMAGKQINIIL